MSFPTADGLWVGDAADLGDRQLVSPPTPAHIVVPLQPAAVQRELLALHTGLAALAARVAQLEARARQSWWDRLQVWLRTQWQTLRARWRG